MLWGKMVLLNRVKSEEGDRKNLKGEMILGTTCKRPSENERKQEAWLAAGAAPSQFSLYLSSFSTHLVGAFHSTCFSRKFDYDDCYYVGSWVAVYLSYCARIPPAFYPSRATTVLIARNVARRRGRISINRRRLAKSRVKSLVDSRRVNNLPTQLDTFK